MDNLEQLEARLWDYIDGAGSADERSAIEALIAENSEWRSKYSELLSLHESINLVELEQPSLRFTRNVMDEIARLQIAPAAKKYINNKIIWGIGVFFIAMIIGMFVYGIGQIDWAAASDKEASLGIDLNKVDYSRVFNNNLVNVFMMLNVILGMFLLDRYLNRKRNERIANQ